MPIGGVQYDDRGRPYIMQGTRKIYISPVAMGGKLPTDTTGIFRKGPQWNQYTGEVETPIDWSNIANIAVAAGLTTGAANAFMAAPTVAGASSPTLGGMYSAAPTITSQGVASLNAFGLPEIGAAGLPGGQFYGASAPTGKGGGGFLGKAWGGIKNFFGGGGGDGKGKGGGFNARDWLNLAMFGGQTLTDLWAANKQAGASDRAAALQAESAREALDLLREQWEKYNKDYELFLKAGQGAIGRLSGRAEGATPPAIPASVQRRLSGSGDTYTPGGVHTPMTLGQFGQPRPVGAGQTPAAVAARPPVSTTMPVTQRPAIAPPATPVSTTMPVDERPQLVLMEAPTGERREVSADKVAMFERKGARRVA